MEIWCTRMDVMQRLIVVNRQRISHRTRTPHTISCRVHDSFSLLRRMLRFRSWLTNDLSTNLRHVFWLRFVHLSLLLLLAYHQLFQGKGYPDICTRLMLKILCDHLQIPCFALMDADAHGIDIFVVYKYGPKVGYYFCFLIIFCFYFSRSVQ
jgi:hypothetical protein